MITKNFLSGAGFLLLLWSPFSQSISNSQLSVDISAESVARISLYYRGLPVPEEGIDFTLPVNGLSQKLERTSSNFYLVGNVDQADIIFDESEFILPQIYGGNTKMLLDGNFIFGGSVTSAGQTLRIPVLDNISQGTSVNGLKIKFSSKLTAGNYTKGDYANVFTLIVTPVI
ncbi:hypothetical protein BTJ39_03240 [Izhakiella australiensis]|uniref:Fimbrial protein n=1 Tax=Izhakiella australiensis TaxID=1926881 RepID=A0A1S8YTL8_9GAMM|nr:hypothetical protein [Izhakiella australiensis]OON42178.1 hypothetical protein BTJ39_03240 [Izhakiella australiensis]